MSEEEKKTELDYTNLEKQLLKLTFKLCSITERCKAERIVNISLKKGICDTEKQAENILIKFVEDSELPLEKEKSRIIRTDLRD